MPQSEDQFKRGTDMPHAKILRTTVTPDGDDDLVQLEIADVLLPAADEANRLSLAVRVPAYYGPRLAYLQYQAIIEIAMDAPQRGRRWDPTPSVAILPAPLGLLPSAKPKTHIIRHDSQRVKSESRPRVTPAGIGSRK